MKLIQSMLKGRNHIFPHHFMARWPPKCGELADIPSSGGNCLPSQLRMLFYVAYYCELMSLREFSTHHRYVLRVQPGFGFEHLSIITFLWFFHGFSKSSSSTVSSSFLENGFFSVKYFVVIKFLQTKMISSAKRATDQRQQQKPFPCFLGQQRRQQRTQIIFHMHTLDDYLLPFWCGLIRRQAQTFLFF